MNLNNSLRQTPIAVIGLSAIFADACNVEEFWTNIVQAKDSITDVPSSRWNIEDYYDPDMTAPDKTYCKRGGFLPNIDFNPMEFGLPPNILEVTDASQLLGLVAARDVLEDAGYGKNSPRFTAALKEKTGVLLGVGGGQKLITPLIARLQYPIWEKALRSSGIAEEDISPIIERIKKAYVSWNENAFPGLLGNVISGRITNRFDLGGINSVVDAACAASLSAVKMSLSELVEGRCDMMITGGVDTDNSPFMYMSFSKTPAFSKSNHITPFADDADGMLIGEGVGMIMLKRLEDAERDGDKIYAVVKGVGTSSDGRFKSVYAPRSSGQALAMNRAYEEAGYPAASVGLLEAHGTGTGAGDPTEFESMQMVFGKDNPIKQHIGLGSVKSQVGHTKAAAGAAGMIKAILALHHKVLPPTINVTQPNSKFNIEDSAIYINTETRPWFTEGQPRRSGVSAFGFGGINVHVAMEEYQPVHVAPYRMHTPYKSVLLQANDYLSLVEICKTSLSNLRKDDADVFFHEITATISHAVIPASAARLGFVAETIEDAIQSLETALQQFQSNTESWDHPKGIYYRKNGMDTTGKVAALFSGQGSQYVGMGKSFVNAFPIAREVMTKADNVFQLNNSDRLTSKIYPIPVFNKEDGKAQQIELTKTQHAQPAIGSLSVAMYKVLNNSGLKTDYLAGHSFGELTALWAAGVYDEATFLSLAEKRGAAMGTPSNKETGTMLAVKEDASVVEPFIKSINDVFIANVNSTNQVVLGGSQKAIEEAMQVLKNNGMTCIPLPVAAAFHTHYVEHAQKPFAGFIHKQKFNTPTISVYSNSKGLPYPTKVAEIKSLLKEQILNPVLFKNQVENMYRDGARIFIEFGPKGVLTNLVKTILKGKDFIAVALNANAKKDSDLQFRQAVLQLQVLGLPIVNPDTYAVKNHIPKAPPKMNVKISGNNYVSASTQKAYQDVMDNGFKIKGGGTQIIEKIVEKPIIKEVEKIVEVEKIIEVEKIVEKIIHSPEINNNQEDMNKQLVDILQSTLEHFKVQQTKSLEVFERFLSEQNAQSQQLLEILAKTVSSNGEAVSTNGVARVNTVMSNQVANTTHATVAANSNGASRTVTPTVVATPPPVAAPTAPAGGGLDRANIEKILLEVISEKTGYPAEMLELSMDMEADLGIDSIKRVEIFGAMTEDNPEISGINPQELTELRTLGQIVDFIAGNATSTNSPQTANNSQQTNQQISEPANATNQQINNSSIEKILLEVISEKTGYPAEMLELSMDMEADLGIDSIKRVEIFGAMTEDNPQISGINPQELTELRTLGQIVDYIAQNGAKK